MVCSALILMPVYGYGDGDTGDGTEVVVASDDEGVKDGPYRSSADSGKPPLRRPAQEKSEPFGNKYFVVTGDVGFVTNYLYRGFTETFGGPAVQGEIVISQKREEGLFAGIWGSNVDNTTAANGSGLEALISGGYIYKSNEDLSLKLELRYTRYPGAFASSPATVNTKDSWNMFEIIPGFTYKYFTFYVAVSTTNASGYNQNFVQDFYTPIAPNGNTKGSWYTEGSLNIPIPNTADQFSFKLLAGYWHIRNYSMLSYAVVGAGLCYTAPENYGGLNISINASATTGKKKYYTNVNDSGQSKVISSPAVWAGVLKKF